VRAWPAIPQAPLGISSTITHATVRTVINGIGGSPEDLGLQREYVWQIPV
jgi:hypothetical protein